MRPPLVGVFAIAALESAPQHAEDVPGGKGELGATYLSVPMRINSEFKPGRFMSDAHALTAVDYYKVNQSAPSWRRDAI
eukprot:6191196-Pleurochrysis_carterae.AAC.1